MTQNEQNEQPVQGTVIEALPAAKFKVQIDEQTTVIAHLSGKMRIHHIRVYPGDTVLMRLSPDGKLGIITRRL